ncbi:MAG: hypothetical protein QM538_06100 [Methylacidiphilales bacterium]|nr:hypothetical protein [Candidatus Methylacidiphilales bacterium]
MISKIVVFVVGCIVINGIVVAEEVSTQVVVPPVKTPEAQKITEVIEPVVAPPVSTSEVPPPPPEFRKPSRSVSITREIDKQKATVTHHVGGDVYNIFIEGDNNTVIVPVPDKAPDILPTPEIKEKVELPAQLSSSKPTPTKSSVVVMAGKQKKEIYDAFFGFSIYIPFLTSEKSNNQIRDNIATTGNLKIYLGSWFDDGGFGFEIGQTKIGNFDSAWELEWEPDHEIVVGNKLFSDVTKIVSRAEVSYLRFMLGGKTEDGIRLYASLGRYEAKIKYSVEITKRTYNPYNYYYNYYPYGYTRTTTTISGSDKKDGKLVGLGLDMDIDEHASFRVDLNRYVDLGSHLGFDYKHVHSIELGFNARF